MTTADTPEDSLGRVTGDMETAIVKLDSFAALINLCADAGGETEKAFYALSNCVDSLRGEFEDVHTRLLKLRRGERNAAASA